MTFSGIVAGMATMLHPLRTYCAQFANGTLADSDAVAPARWGYVVGAEIARGALRAGMSWPELLGGDAREILLAAADVSDGEWAESLRAVLSEF